MGIIPDHWTGSLPKPLRKLKVERGNQTPLAATNAPIWCTLFKVHESLLIDISVGQRNWPPSCYMTFDWENLKRVMVRDFLLYGKQEAYCAFILRFHTTYFDRKKQYCARSNGFTEGTLTQLLEHRDPSRRSIISKRPLS